MKHEYYKYFETRKRDNGDTFVTCDPERRPEELHVAIFAAHDGMLPNDWVYAACRSACKRIEGELRDESHMPDSVACDTCHEWADGEVDVYNSKRYQWASEFCNSNLFATGQEYASDYGQKDQDITDTLGAIQYGALQFIFGAMLALYTADEEEGGDE